MVWLIKDRTGKIIFHCRDFAICRDYWKFLTELDPDAEFYIDYAWEM